MQSKVFRVFPKLNHLSEVEKAQGSFLYVAGSKLLDLTAGGTSYAILGWNDPQVNQSISEQMEKFGHIDYKIWNDPNIEKLANLIIGQNLQKLSKVYFSGNSGAEGCEAAMKMSFQTHHVQGKSNKKWFISRKQSYHGSTSDALALGDRPNLEFYRTMLSPYRMQIPMHHFKKMSLKGESPEQYSIRSAGELESAILKLGPENVSAFVGETIMGGLVGDVPPTPGYWRAIRSICDKYDVHLILDEVYCGTGTSGRYFCFEYDGIEPDFVFMGKTLAAGYGSLSVVCTTTAIYDAISNCPDERLQHTTTHQGHSLSVAAAMKVQELIRSDGFLEEVQTKGELFRNSLLSGLRDHPGVVDIRGRGLRFSLEHDIAENNQIEFGKELEYKMRDSYKVLINSKWHRICFTPPLILSKDEIIYASNSFVVSFKELYDKYKLS